MLLFLILSSPGRRAEGPRLMCNCSGLEQTQVWVGGGGRRGAEEKKSRIWVFCLCDARLESGARRERDPRFRFMCSVVRGAQNPKEREVLSVAAFSGGGWF